MNETKKAVRPAEQNFHSKQSSATKKSSEAEIVQFYSVMAVVFSPLGKCKENLERKNLNEIGISISKLKSLSETPLARTLKNLFSEWELTFQFSIMLNFMIRRHFKQRRTHQHTADSRSIAFKNAYGC